MQPVWKLLAPVDLNEDSEAVVRQAIAMAKGTAAELVLLYVMDREFYKQARDAAWPPSAFTDGPNLTIRRVVLPGEPAATVCRYADFIDADMVLMASRGYSRWPRFWKQSVTRAVLRSTRRGVCITDTTQLDEDAMFRCQRILCVLTLDGTDDGVAEFADRLAARSGGQLTLAHVVPAASEGLLCWGASPMERPLSTATAVARIRDLAGALQTAYRTEVTVGSEPAAVARVARETAADLIIVGRSPVGGVRGYYPDMAAVLKRVTCPVLSVAIGRTYSGEHSYESSRTEQAMMR